MTHSAIPAWRRIDPRSCLPAVLMLAALIAFWRLGGHGVRLWDETRYGENALQMLKRGDFLNYYFDDQMDDWVAKPPLGMWLIALAYKLVGFNEWALRLPSAVAGVICVFVTYRLVRLFKGPYSASLAALALITCRGILGPHVSRSGDLDALYVAAALGVVYFMVRYTHLGERRALPLAALCAGLCFFAKGFMLLLFLPGLGLFLLLRGEVFKLLKEGYFWLGVAILGCFIGGWYLVIQRYGNRFPASGYGRDAWDVMLNYDIRRRFTEKLEGDNTTPAFVFEALDTRFSPWLYPLYLSLLALAWQTRGKVRLWWEALRRDELSGLCVAMSLTTCLVLANSATKFNWYFAITTPFLAILTVQLMRRALAGRFRLFAGVFALAWLGGAVMQALSVARREDGLTDAILEHPDLIAKAAHIYSTRPPAFNTTLALKWRQRTIDGLPPAHAEASLTLVQAKLGIIKEGNGEVFSVLLLPGVND